MAVPILKIPVDDAAFQRYMQAFKKYQDQLTAQPEMWQGINKGVQGAALAQAAMAAAMASQTEETEKLAAAEKKRQEASQRADRQRRQEEQDIAKREEAAAKRRKDAINQVREYARTVADTALTLGKWALGGGLLGTVLGGFGLEQLVSGVADQRRLAGGLGVSMGQQQGASLNMQRYFDVNSVMESVANAQANPGSWGVFRMMGIDPSGKSPSDLTYEAARAARRMFIADRGNLGLASAQGLTQIFSPDDLRRMASEKPGQFEASIRQGRAYNGLSDEVGRKWQNFMVNLDTAGMKLKNALVDKLTVLEPDLERIISKFSQLAVQVLDRVDFDALGRGLDSFTKYIGSPQFQTDFKTFADDVGLVAIALKNALVWLNVIPDTGPKRPQGPLESSTRWGVDLPPIFKKGWDWFMKPFVSNNSKADRYHNPLNLTGPGGKFRHFDNDAQGAAAGARQLLVDFDKHGQHTVRQLINDPHHGWSNEWAPGNSHAATANYIASVARALGVNPDSQINLHDDTTLRKLIVAMNAVERGGRRPMQMAAAGGTPARHPGHVAVTIKNQTGASVATNLNSAVRG